MFSFLNWFARSYLDRLCQGYLQFKEICRWLYVWHAWPVLSWIRAAQCFRDCNYRKAALFYEVGLKKNSNHPACGSARFDLAYCHYRMTELDLALSSLDRCISEGSDLVEVYLLASRINFSLGNLVKAAKILEEFLETHSDEISAICALLHVKLASPLVSELDARYWKTVLLRLKSRLSLNDERNALIDTALAHFEISLGDEQRGDKILARVLACGSAPFEAVLIRGERFFQHGRLLQAREQFSRALTASPKDPRPVLLLARSYLIDGEECRPDWAITLAESACCLSGWKNAGCLAVLISALYANKEAAKAQMFRELAKSLPSANELFVDYYPFSAWNLERAKASNS